MCALAQRILCRLDNAGYEKSLKWIEIPNSSNFCVKEIKENTQLSVAIVHFFQKSIKLFTELFASQLQACGLVFPTAVVY